MNSKSEAILSRTIELLKKSTQEVSIDDIAAFAKASKMTVYKYFGDKNNLLLAACNKVLDQSQTAFEQAVQTDGGLIEQMQKYLVASAEFVDGGGYALCNRFKHKSEPISQRLIKYQESTQQMLRQLIAEGKREDLFISGFNEDLIFHYISMGTDYYRNNEGYREKMNEDSDFKDNVIHFLVGNIFKSQVIVE